MATVRPCQPFDPVKDAEDLKAAFKGWGCDEKAVMDIITKRSNEQRQLIRERFKTMYGKDLIKELKSELKGNFEDVIVALMIPPWEYYAKECHHAMSGLGTNEKCLIEILGTHTNAEIMAIRDTYEKLYGNSLEKDLKGDTSGSIKRLMVALVTACRDESGVVSDEAAHQDAVTLLRAGELFAGTDESAFNQILCQRNKAQLKVIFDKYQLTTGHDFESAIQNEFSGTTQDILLDLVKSIRNQNEYLAERLFKSMDGVGTDDRTLIRIVVSRSEVDLGYIKEVFATKYEKSLAQSIQDDTSGDYKNALLLIVGE